MKQIYGSSRTGDLKAAVSGISNPAFLILMSNEKQFEEHVAQLEAIFPGVPSIGAIGISYGAQVCDNGVGVVGFTGVAAVANVLEEVSTMPAKYISRIEQDLKTIHAEKGNTVCIDLCTGNDACVLTTIDTVLGKAGIQLMGGTGDQGKVSCNGKIYTDADAYALVKNQGGRVKVYKENVYKPMEQDYRFIASNTDRSKYYMGKLNGKPAKKVYMETLGIPEKAIGDQTMKNPFGKMIGNDICIISIKEVVGDGLACFRQVNDSDVLTLLELRDYKEVVQDTTDRIHADFNKISAVFSLNCVFRYLLFMNNGVFDDYLKRMGALGSHCGYVGYGEHNCNQFINQSMTCVVFE